MRLHNDYADDWPGCCLLYANLYACTILLTPGIYWGVLARIGLLCIYWEIVDSVRILFLGIPDVITSLGKITLIKYFIFSLKIRKFVLVNGVFFQSSVFMSLVIIEKQYFHLLTREIKKHLTLTGTNILYMINFTTLTSIRRAARRQTSDVINVHLTPSEVRICVSTARKFVCRFFSSFFPDIFIWIFLSLCRNNFH